MTTIQEMIYRERAGLLKENFGDDHDFSSLKPHHSYTTKDGHQVDVHIFNNPNGKHAIFYNKNLNGITKLVHWEHNAEHPTKDELEKAGHEEFEEENRHLNEEKKELGLLGDTGGKVTEHSAIIHLIHHMHSQHGTYGSVEHKKDLAPHEKALKDMNSKYVTNKTQEKEFRVRQAHGKAAASSMIESLKQKHGPHVRIAAVGHTAKEGDIGKFTNGKHNDTQDNPSDITVKTYVPGHLKEEFGAGHEHSYEGFSLKSSKSAKRITTKNPAIHLDGMLDHPSRKLNTEKIAREGLKKVHHEMGHGGKSAAERGRFIETVRKKEGVPNHSSVEEKASKLAQPVHKATAEELHDHIHHLLHHTGDEGHRIVGRMLKKHLTPHTGMPWSKVHVMGNEEHKVKASVTPGSEHPLNKVFNSKKTKYAVSRSGATVTLHKVEKDGSHTALAHYRPKTNSNALKSDTSNYTVTPAYSH
jgi:hypothetical protein